MSPRALLRLLTADLDMVMEFWGHTGPVPGAWTGRAPELPIDQDELDAVLLNWNQPAAGTAARCRRLARAVRRRLGRAAGPAESSS